MFGCGWMGNFLGVRVSVGVEVQGGFWILWELVQEENNVRERGKKRKRKKGKFLEW